MTGTRVFGNLTGGLGRDAEDFLTVYYFKPIWVRG